MVEWLFDINPYRFLFPKTPKFWQERGVGFPKPKILKHECTDNRPILLLYFKKFIFRDNWSGKADISGKERAIIWNTHISARTYTHTYTHARTHAHTYTHISHAHTHITPHHTQNLGFSTNYNRAYPPLFVFVFDSHQVCYVWCYVVSY